MSVREIKKQLAALPRTEQDEVIAYLFHLRHADDTDAKACRASARIDWYPNACCPGSGFRIALTVDHGELGQPDGAAQGSQP